MSWPRYVEGTTSISRLMHKQTYLTFVNYYRNYYIINYYIDHRLPDCRQWHAMYTAFKFITNRLILHKVHKTAYSKKSPGLLFFNPNAEMSLLGNLFELFFQCLGSLCTFHFIYKIVSVQNIVQMYAEQHTVASVLLLDEESDALLKINDVFIKIQNTEHFWSGYEGHRSSFRP